MKPSHLKRLGLQFVSLIILTSEAHPQLPFDVDTNFRTGIDRVYVSSVLPLADGTVILSGQMQLPGLASEKRTVKLNATGVLDPSYYASSLGTGRLTAWDNDLVYVASITTVRRLLPNGHLDPDFIEMNLGPYFGSVQGGDYHVFPDGRVLMSGAHILSDTQRGFEGLYNLIWFSNQGYLDTTRIHRYCDEVIFEIEEQPSGKFLCSGTMNSFEDQSVKRVFRVHSDGALDNSFDADIQQWGEAFVFKTLPDDRILAGGVFKRPGSTDTLALLRLLPDGTLDPTFHMPLLKANFSPNSPLAYVLDILPLPDGKLVITGRFDEVDGQVRGGIAMLDADGNLLGGAFTGEGCGEYEYVTPSGSSAYKGLSGITPAADGNFYIYGAYHGYDDGTTNDTAQRMVSRLYGLDVGVQEQQVKPLVRLWPNPGNSILNIVLPDLAERPVQLELNDAQGRTIARRSCWSTTCTWEIQDIAPGPYTVKIQNGTGTVAVQWIKQ